VSKEIIELPSQFGRYESSRVGHSQRHKTAAWRSICCHGRHYAGVGLALKRRQFRKPLPVWCIIRIARGGERVIESSGFGGRNSPADCRCRMTDNSEVTGVHEKRLCARPAPDAEVETATVPSIVQTATQATGWIAG
jgi:hypothetical protein